MVIKKALRIALAQADKTQEWLADELNSNPAQISRWANANDLKTSVVERIAKAFDMSLSEFLAQGEK